MRYFGTGLLAISRVFLTAIIVFLPFSSHVYADESLSLSVTPPLFQLTIGPGESWSSAIKIVNSNTFEVTYYAQVVDFEAQGEDGRSAFIPLVHTGGHPEGPSFSLASWVQISPNPIVVPAGTSAEVPFTIQIPSNAEPGGHYGAILIGTEPTGVLLHGATMKVSSVVSSLIFTRIKGEALERGRIREFVSTNTWYQAPKADFVLRFENTGTTHLKPQGDITIYNMWGKERGRVPINNESGGFGNVLPKSIRKFTFSWEGESSLLDIGPYRAVVTLAFGDESKQNISASTYFWIVPVVPVAVGCGIIALFTFLLTWFMRRYIRRALELEHKRHGGVRALPVEETVRTTRNTLTIEALIEPIREGVIDLRAITHMTPHHTVAPKDAPPSSDQRNKERDSLTVFQLLGKYKVFIFFIILCVVAGVSLRMYFRSVLVYERGFQVKDVTIQEETVR